ncbi:MAG: Hsp20/alpha crystallin family protein [Candidatus Micrarchaeota archaeon]
MIAYTPYEDLLRIKRSVDRMMENFGADENNTGIRVPLVDMEGTKDELILYVEMPGIGKDQIKLTVMENVVTVLSDKREIDKKKEYYYVERQFLNYFRTIPLPEDVNISDVKTDHRNGVLEIRLKKQNKKVQMKTVNL